MRLGIDVDGVLYKWEPTARFMLKQKFGIDLPESKTWLAIPETIGKDQWQWLWSGGVKHGLFRHGNCYKNSFSALEELSQKHQIVLITSRPKQAVEDTLAWVAFHKIPATEIHILGPEVKKSTIPCDLYVDDKPENIHDVVAAGFKGLLWTRPWNESAVGFERIFNWKGLTHYIETQK